MLAQLGNKGLDKCNMLRVLHMLLKLELWNYLTA